MLPALVPGAGTHGQGDAASALSSSTHSPWLCTEPATPISAQDSESASVKQQRAQKANLAPPGS